MSTYPRVRYEVEHGRVGLDRGSYKRDPDGIRMVVPADAIVIERAELPVWPKAPAFILGVEPMSSDAARAQARSLLALAEYLDAHPPVPPVSDEDVETLAAQVFIARWPGISWAGRGEEQKDDYRAQARRLLATVRVAVTK